jgi:proteasome lid subunit RPN8/RPN11
VHRRWHGDRHGRGGVIGVEIAARAHSAVVAHARAALPSESCGVLVGRDGHIVDAVAARNLSDDPHRFLIDPQDHIDARRDARRRGLDVIGFYHSHPDAPAVPSRVDRAEANYPDHFYLIVGCLSDREDVRIFRLTDGVLVETPFAIVR